MIYDYSEKEFWSRVKKMPSGCWEWQGKRKKWENKYGSYYDGVRQMAAHRWIYIQRHGDMSPSIFVRHLCNNPLCVRLSHLAAGTHKENMKDAMKAGTHVAIYNKEHWREFSGENSPVSKLKEWEVREIIKARHEGVRNIDSARKYGVTTCCISDIIQCRSWTYLERPWVK